MLHKIVASSRVEELEVVSNFLEQEIAAFKQKKAEWEARISADEEEMWAIHVELNCRKYPGHRRHLRSEYADADFVHSYCRTSDNFKFARLEWVASHRSDVMPEEVVYVQRILDAKKKSHESQQIPLSEALLVVEAAERFDFDIYITSHSEEHCFSCGGIRRVDPAVLVIVLDRWDDGCDRSGADSLDVKIFIDAPQIELSKFNITVNPESIEAAKSAAIDSLRVTDDSEQLQQVVTHLNCNLDRARNFHETINLCSECSSISAADIQERLAEEYREFVELPELKLTKTPAS